MAPCLASLSKDSQVGRLGNIMPRKAKGLDVVLTLRMTGHESWGHCFPLFDLQILNFYHDTVLAPMISHLKDFTSP